MTMPAVSAKRPSCFSIDSLISKSDKREALVRPSGHSPPHPYRSPSSSPDVPPLPPRGHNPPVSRGAPVPPPASLGAPHPALLHGANTVYPGGLPPGFDPTHPLFANPAMLAHPMAFPGASPRGFGGGHPHSIPGMHPAAAGAHGPLGPAGGKDGAPFYSWLLARHGNFLGQRFSGTILII